MPPKPTRRQQHTQYELVSSYRSRLANDITKMLTTDHYYTYARPTQHGVKSARSRTIGWLGVIGAFAFVIGIVVSVLAKSLTPLILGTLAFLLLLLVPRYVLNKKRWVGNYTKMGQLLESRYGVNYSSLRFLPHGVRYIESLNTKPSSVDKDKIRVQVEDELNHVLSYQAPTQYFKAVTPFGVVPVDTIPSLLRS